MSDPKTVIVILCKLVKLVCKYQMQPNYFKYAKHNNTEENVVCEFWNLLNTFSDTLDNDNIVQNVKIYFATLNYKSLEFYSLPDDMSFGSRELLLAFSWLIGKHNVLERIIKDLITKSIMSEEFISDSNRYVQQPLNHSYENFTLKDYHNHIIMLAGKININLKMISEYNEKILKLMQKVHAQTSIANSSHLSVAETYQIKKIDSFQSYLNKIKFISELLNINSKWKAKEKIYWDWMITVMQMKTDEKSICIDKDVLGSFFKILRAHAKQLLSSEPTNRVEILDENKFSRCLKLNVATKKNNSQTMLLKNEKYLRDIRDQEKHNVQKIINYLCTMIK